MRALIWAVVLALVVGLSPATSLAQPVFLQGFYREIDGPPNYTRTLDVIGSAVGGNRIVNFAVIRQPSCTGQWNMTLVYDVPADYVANGNPPLMPTSGTCTGTWNCGNVIINCGGVQLAPGVITQPTKQTLNIAGNYAGTYQWSYEKGPVQRFRPLIVRYRVSRSAPLFVPGVLERQAVITGVGPSRSRR